MLHLPDESEQDCDLHYCAIEWGWCVHTVGTSDRKLLMFPWLQTEADTSRPCRRQDRWGLETVLVLAPSDAAWLWDWRNCHLNEQKSLKSDGHCPKPYNPPLASTRSRGFCGRDLKLLADVTRSRLESSRKRIYGFWPLTRLLTWIMHLAAQPVAPSTWHTSLGSHSRFTLQVNIRYKK